MAVISLTITESTDQIVSGVPRTVGIEANLPSTIFYTLDGTEPDSSSYVYTSAIKMPTNLMTVTLKIYATNGVDSSAIIMRIYRPNVSDLRYPHADVIGVGNTIQSYGPFGTNAPGNVKYDNPANVGITVDDPEKTQIATGLFDENGASASQTNEPLTSYDVIYPNVTSEGQVGPAVGIIPAKINVTAKTPEYGPETSNRQDSLFNPKAFVIFQDAESENPNDPPHINREFFSLENPGVVRDGALLFNHGGENPAASGSFLRSYINQRDNTITYYYYDNSVNRWIISKQPYEQRNPNLNNLGSMVFGREKTNGFVFKWIPFQRRVLF